jgi:hypothetical protein
MVPIRQPTATLGFDGVNSKWYRSVTKVISVPSGRKHLTYGYGMGEGLVIRSTT